MSPSRATTLHQTARAQIGSRCTFGPQPPSIQRRCHGARAIAGHSGAVAIAVKLREGRLQGNGDAAHEVRDAAPHAAELGGNDGGGHEQLESSGRQSWSTKSICI